MNRLDFIESREEITADYAPGEVISVAQHDGSMLKLRKLAPDYDPADRIKAMNYVQEHAAAGEIVTGLLYLSPEPADLHQYINTVDTPLNQLGARELCPGASALERINKGLR